MTNEEIRELIQLVMDTGVAELEVQRGENRVRIRRAGSAHEVSIPASQSTGQTHTAVPGIAQTAAVAAPSAPPAANEVIVKSPIVGTFYESPKPSDPPFVKVGD